MRFLALIGGFSAVFAVTAFAASGRHLSPKLQDHPIAWTIGKPVGEVVRGKPFRIKVHGEIAEGWHVYSTTQPPGGPKQTRIFSADTFFAISGSPHAREPEIAPDDNFGIVTETYVDSVDWTMTVIPRVAGPGKLHLTVAYQTCTNRICITPAPEQFTVAMNVAAATDTAVVVPAAAPPPAPTAATVTPPPTVKVASTPAPAATTQSFVLFLVLAAGMGALSLLTPCVFPMIPITVSYFTRGTETSRGSPARNALVYAAGIVGTFTVLGMVIAVLVGAGGINRFAANPWINLLVTAVFVAFALNLFGVYQIGVPASLLTRLDSATRRSGGSETLGILLMGLTFTLTSFTCTTPFVGTLLVSAAQGNWLWPLAGLLVFSGVFAIPFFLLALMPSAVAKLPRSGAWLQSVKVVMGFVEIATALKFLSNADLVWRWGVVSRNVVLAAWLLIAVLTGLYLLGLVGSPNRSEPVRRGPVRIGFALMAFAVAAYLGRGLSGSRLGEFESFLPPPEGGIATGSTAHAGELPWMVNDYEGGLARARAERKLVLIDFTGYTCTNCRWMEANMFPRKEIVAAMDGFVRVRLYTDGLGEVYERQQKMEQDKLGTVALPYYAVVDTLGVVQSQYLGMTRSSSEFIDFLHGKSMTTP